MGRFVGIWLDTRPNQDRTYVLCIYQTSTVRRNDGECKSVITSRGVHCCFFLLLIFLFGLI
ncbi:uncharacterized protein BDW47DRAFT_103034 [Aspergillus candidus]|uniref:Uncharacterized protein n=1 Tax=Aspergillus candidus TaxID=41067 RepID=A0A2I2FFM2_ASPCN|nr:hypothetical protein BDW47DRAFT_103034 [Aspergillus candidus]PLB39423.1 hypothetical protein BDW47DRAFT_103034 [Aspergillus candidus]